MQSRLPKRNLAVCTRVEVECQFLLASILTVFAAERSLAFRSRVATRYGIKPLSHPAVRQPRSSDRWTWSPVEQTGEPRSFVCRAPGAEETHRVERPYTAGPRGFLNTTRPVRLQTSRRATLVYRLRATTRWPPAEERLHAPQEDDSLRR
jgi:hypothetical protein